MKDSLSWMREKLILHGTQFLTYLNCHVCGRDMQNPIDERNVLQFRPRSSRSVNIRIFRARLHDAINSQASERARVTKKLSAAAIRQISPIDKSAVLALESFGCIRITSNVSLSFVRICAAVCYLILFRYTRTHACNSADAYLSLTNARRWKTVARDEVKYGPKRE